MDTARIESLSGLKGTFHKDENVFRLSKPRDDVKVLVDRLSMPPFMGLTSWAAFTPMSPSRVMVMGDLVLFEDEVNPVMSAALDSGLEVTALHNHFFFDEPKVYFMHIGGMGSVDQLATGVKKLFDTVTEIRAAQPQPARQFPGDIAPQSSIAAQPMETILGRKGESNNGMFKIVIGRSGKMHGMRIGNQMGVNTWAGFAGTDEQAVVDGDFAMLESELQPVLRAMRKAGINIVAIHQHMSQEQPRYLFLHYWGKGKALDLARGLKATLDAQAAAPK
ncbi:MAG: DUF1259 domain-containing protein [Casimicrobiaceae bacterium]